MPRYILAYSGGLDTSVLLKWLILNDGAEITTFTADLGQKIELEGVREKALACGAKDAHVHDLTEDFVNEFVLPAFRAGALYQGIYPMATSLGRPLIARELVKLAQEVGAEGIVHGCTGKGNDQVRIEVGVAALAPELKCLAPLRYWPLKTRDEEIAWAGEHGVPVTATKKSPYSLDQNIWGISIEAGPLEDPWAAPPGDAWQWTKDPFDAPPSGADVMIGFDEGLPVSLDGETMDPVSLITRLNELGAMHGVGRIDMVEDRLVGIKSRELYEAPAATILHTARVALEQVTLDKNTRRMRDQLSAEYAQLVYDGLWFSPLRESLQSFMDASSQNTSGEVRMFLHRGSATVTGRRSDVGLYRPELATYGDDDAFSHDAAAGFIQLHGLPSRVAGIRKRTSAGVKS